MRRLIRICYLLGIAGVLSASLGCRREEKITLEPTDETAPILVSSVLAGDTQTSIQLIRGFHTIEQGSWRWTMGRFAVALLPPPEAENQGAVLTLKFTLPPGVMDRSKIVKLSATVQKIPVGEQTYQAIGDYTFAAEVPAKLLKVKAVTAEFALDPFLPAGLVDGRELGLVFLSASLHTK